LRFSPRRYKRSRWKKPLERSVNAQGGERKKRESAHLVIEDKKLEGTD